MIVAYIANRFPRWAGGWVLNEVRGLIDAGVDLRIFSFNPPPDDVASQPGMAPWVGRTTYVPRGSSGSCLRAAAACLARSPAGFLRGARTAMALGGRMARSGHLPEIFFLADRIRAAGAGLVHAQHADYLADAAMSAAACLGLPFTFTGHANDLYTHPGRLALKLRAASAVATCTGFNERYMKETFPEEAGKVTRVYHGVDLTRFQPAAAPGDAPGRLVTVTRLKEKKGFPWLLEAVARLRAEGLEVTLDIYGDGDQRGAIASQIAQLGLAGCVTLRGAIAHDRIPGALAGCGVYVLPSVVLPDQDRDGIPNTILEAMACGLPVVSTDISGIPEAVRDQETGLLVPQRDAPALAGALRRMITDEALRRRCGREGRRRVETLFSIEASGRALAGLFGRAAAGAIRPSAGPAGR